MKAHATPQPMDAERPQALLSQTNATSFSTNQEPFDDDWEEEDNDEDEDKPSLYPRPPRRNRSKLFWTVAIVALFFFLWPTSPNEAVSGQEATTEEVPDMTVVFVSKDDIYYYHLDKDCPGLTDPLEWVRSEAEKRNYFPCPVCAKE